MIKLSNGMRLGQFNFFQNRQNARKNKRNDAVAGRNRGLLLWLPLLLGLLGMLFGFDAIAEALGEVASLLLEFAQQSLESLYHKQLKLDLYHAQMATAYTGFAILMGAGYLLIKKTSENILLGPTKGH